MLLKQKNPLGFMLIQEFSKLPGTTLKSWWDMCYFYDSVYCTGVLCLRLVIVLLTCT